MMRCGLWRTEIESWIRDYDNVQRLAVRLIYTQIGCALIGSSLGVLYNGVLLVNLGLSLFALVAIESSSQSLARTYAFLLFFSILLDVAWFCLFSRDIWHVPSKIYGTSVVFSLKLTLAMQIAGFSLRLFSSLLWIQMYRLGVSYIDNSVPRDTDVDLRNSFLSPTPVTLSIDRRPSGTDDVVGGSIYDPAYYSSLFDDGRDDSYSLGVGQNRGISAANSFNGAETSQPDSPMGQGFHAKEVGQNRVISPGYSVNGAKTSQPNPPMGRVFHANDVGQNHPFSAADFVNGAETSQLHPPMGKTFDAKDEERKLRIV